MYSPGQNAVALIRDAAAFHPRDVALALGVALLVARTYPDRSKAAVHALDLGDADEALAGALRIGGAARSDAARWLPTALDWLRAVLRRW